MSLRFMMQGLLMAVLAGACASSSEAERPVGPPPRVLFQSPIALLFEHQGELLLTTDQMIQLGKLQDALEAKNRPLREKLREARRRGPEQEEGPPPGGGISGGRGGRGGMRGIGGMGGRGMGSSHVRSDPPMDEEALRQLEATLRELEDNESAAYNEAEQLLDEKQRARARELISQQREERMRVREAMRRRVVSPKT
ncbi:MAG TPA: hypothetical protein VNA24_12070 [Hyalangium sp.]|nr:hypothetical protein [Hyalangium sp.]